MISSAISRRNQRSFAICALCAFALCRPPLAAPLADIPSHLTQPDGTVVPCLLSGDEFYNYAHDSRGYVFMQDVSTGQWVYARKSGGSLVPTDLVAGKADPASAGLSPRVMPDASAVASTRARRTRSVEAPHIRRTGNVNNIVVFVRFADDSEFPENASVFDALLNGQPGTVSMRNYFLEASYGKLNVTSWLVASSANGTIVSYQDSQPRAYYLPYNAVSNPIGYQDNERALREHTLMTNALNDCAGRVPSGVNLDADGDGIIDHVTFVVRGDSGLGDTLLWPHFSADGIEGAKIGGLSGGSYQVQMEIVLLPNNVGVLCHEFFHALGAPDLYHYNSDGIDPVGGWDLMGTPHRVPQHMGAYMKWKYGGWLDTIPELVSDGRYSLQPLTSAVGNCCKIITAGSALEYYVLEYRRNVGLFESSLPGSGLIVTRIRTASTGDFNGPPDEIYVYRPGGTAQSNGLLSLAAYSADSGRTAINDTTDPSGLLTTGAKGGLNVSNIGASGEQISFDLTNQPGLYHIEFSVQPGESVFGSALSPFPEVAVKNTFGQATTAFGLPIQLQLEPGIGTPGAGLIGSPLAFTSNGVASFPELAVTLSGNNFVLRASSAGLDDVLSWPFGTQWNGVSTTRRVSVSNTGAESNGSIWGSNSAPTDPPLAVNPNGTLVAFTDTGTNLTIVPAGGSVGVFVRDLVNSTTRCADLDDRQWPPNYDCTSPALSSDGRYVVFCVIPKYFIQWSTNIYPQVFLRDTITARTVVLSHAPDETMGNLSSSSACISADGRYVAFASTSSNLVAGDANGASDIFICDTHTSVVSCASVGPDGLVGNGSSVNPSITPDGRFVAFTSNATNIIPGLRRGQIYVRDLVTGTTVCASRGPDGTGANAVCAHPSISGDGRFVAFNTAATNLVAGVPQSSSQVFVANVETAAVVCASVDPLGSPCASPAGAPSLSLDGNHVAFTTKSPLTPGAGPLSNAYVRDIRLGRTCLVSRRPGGTPADADTTRCVLSGDGRWVVITTAADNLVYGDTNSSTDAFIYGPLTFSDFTVWDAVSVLRIAGGLSSATSEDIKRLKRDGATGPLNMLDALLVVRAAAGW